MKKFKLFIVISLIFFMFCPTFLTSCGGFGGSGGSSGGSGGSGSGSGGSESGSGGSSEEVDYGSPSSMNIDDYYESVIILTDATSSGVFYDDFSKKEETFKNLLDRQITSFAEHLIFGLKVKRNNATFI